MELVLALRLAFAAINTNRTGRYRRCYYAMTWNWWRFVHAPTGAMHITHAETTIGGNVSYVFNQAAFSGGESRNDLFRVSPIQQDQAHPRPYC